LSEGESLSETTKIHVFDQEYELKINSESGAERLDKVTDLVNRKMKEVAAHYVSLPAKQIAVLAALNLADDYIEIQERLVSESAGEPADEAYTVCLPAYIEKIEAYLESGEH
jgi:cell division protein ZapA